jgi:hypothetical protein
MGNRKNPLKATKEEKLLFISQYLPDFKLLDETYKYPTQNVFSEKIARLIRKEFKYSNTTSDCDIVYPFLNLYREQLLINSKNKMSKDKFNQEEIAQRIKDVLQNKDHSEHHELLKEIFPEIHDQIESEGWNNEHFIGDVYVRIKFDRIYSIIMPIRLSDSKSRSRPSEPVRIYNLCTNELWIHEISCLKGVNRISPEGWKELIGNQNPEEFVRIGKFSKNGIFAMIALQNLDVVFYQHGGPEMGHPR